MKAGTKVASVFNLNTKGVIVSVSGELATVAWNSGTTSEILIKLLVESKA